MSEQIEIKSNPTIMDRVDRLFNLRDQLEQITVRLMDVYKPILREVVTKDMMHGEKITGPSLLASTKELLPEKQVEDFDSLLSAKNFCEELESIMIDSL